MKGRGGWRKRGKMKGRRRREGKEEHSLKLGLIELRRVPAQPNILRST